MEPSNIWHRKRYLAVISLVIAIIVLISGYYFYRFEEKHIVDERHRELKSIAELKINQMKKWMNENIVNADNVSKNPYSLKEIEDLISGKGQPDLKNIIANRLKYRVESFKYENIYLIDKEGKVLLSAIKDTFGLPTVFYQDIEKAFAERKTMFSDFRYCSHHNSIHLMVISPNISANQELLGFLIFQINPYDYLYPLLLDWPTESESAETILFERENNHALILSETKARKNNLLDLKIPLTETSYPAVQGVNGARGIVSGVDYIGKNVLAYLTEIKGTDWLMVSKIDEDEIFAELKFRAYFIIVITTLVILFTGTLAAFIYNAKQRTILQNLVDKETALDRSESLRAVMGSIAKIGGWEFNTETKEGTWTKEVALIHDLDPDRKTNVEIGISFYINDSKEKIINAINNAIENGTPYDLELEMITQKGNHKWVRTIGEAIIENGKVVKVQGSFQDITERKMADEALRESDEKFRVLLQDVNSVAIQGYDMNGITNYWNKASEKLYGYTDEEALGKSLLDTIIPDVLKEGVQSAIKQMLETGTAIPSGELLLKKKDGTLISVFSTHVFLKRKNKEPEFYCIDVDISERKNLEETQSFLIKCGSQGESFFPSLAKFISETLKMEYVCIDKLESDKLVAKTIAVYNKGVFEDNVTYCLQDTPCGEVVDKSICIFPRDVAKIFPKDLVLQEMKAESYIGATLFDSKGKPIGLIAVIDSKPLENSRLNEAILKMIAIRAAGELERMQAEKELKASEEKYKVLFESNYNGISIFYGNPDGTISNFIEVNEAAAKMIGYTKEEMLNLSILDIGDNVTFELIKKQQALLMEKDFINTELRIRHKSGKWIDVEITITTIIYNNRIAVVNIVHDITERKRAMELLKDKEEKLRLAMEVTNQGWFELNIQTGEVLVSDEYKKIIGYGEEEFNSNLDSWFDNIHPSDKELVQIKFNECINTKQSCTVEYRRRAKNGNWVWIRSVGKVVEYDNENKPLKMSGTHADISDKKIAENKLRLQEENFRNLVESMPEGYYKSTPKGKFIYANNAYVKMMGYDSIDELLSVDIPSTLYFKEEDREFYNNEREHFTNEFEMYRLKKKDGSEIWLEDYCRYIKDENGNTIMHEGVCRDITARRKAEEELIKAKEKAEELNRIKTNFLSNMSHELRTPMVGILGFSEVLKKLAADDEQKHYAEIINKSGTRLMDTLNLILNISSIDANKDVLNIKKLNLTEEIKDTLKLFDKSAEQKNLKLEFTASEKELYINGDKKLIFQILNNLINNAIKYTKKGGVNIIAEKHIKGLKVYAKTSITDTGIGIPNNKQDLVWEDFRQASEGLSRGFEGTGLGLSLTKKLVEKLGGEIYIASSVENKGTTFTLLLPIFEEHELYLHKPSNIKMQKENTGSLTGNLKFLYVDDDILSVEFVKLLIKPFGTVDVSTNGIDGIEKAKTNRYDIILMDINLGKNIDGIETTEIIRTIKGYELTPVIAVTALAMQEDKEEFLRRGCTHYISKPFLKEDFTELIKRVSEEIIK